jgi:hypothetical protein
VVAGEAAELLRPAVPALRHHRRLLRSSRARD